MTMRGRRLAGIALVAGAVALPWAMGAQQSPDQEISESQRRLQQIRQERQQLRGELSRIRSRVGDVSAEIRNIQRQQQVSSSLLREINLQLEETAKKIDETTLEVAHTQAELVEKRRWISQSRFLHALNFCMLLPGPEAQQLAIYIGWLLHRVRGGLIAGLLFLLPSLLLLTGLGASLPAAAQATAPRTLAAPRPGAWTPDPIDPAAIPSLAFDIDDLRIADARLGKASLRTRPTAAGLRIERLQANTPTEAILWHGGEAEGSREAFRTAQKRDRDALIAFLESL